MVLKAAMCRTHSRHSMRAGWSGKNTSSMSSYRPSRRSTRPEIKTSEIWCLGFSSITSSITTRNRDLDSGMFYWFSRRRGILGGGIVFRLVTQSVPDLSDQHRVRMARLREATRVEERAFNDKLAKIHKSVAAPPFMDAVRRYGRAGHGEIVEGDAVIKSLKSALETVVENANLLTTTMATKLVDFLSSGQAVKFLTAVMQFQLKIRSLGLERDAEKQREMSGGGGGWSPISRRW